MGKSAWFWRNVVLIALVHVALIAGLIRWSVAARASTNAESIVWLGSAEALAGGESSMEASPPPKPATVSEEAPKVEAEEEKPALTTAKSEIELPSVTPKPTPASTPVPKPSVTPTPKPKPTPKAIPKSTPNKAPVTKASPKSSPKETASRTKPTEKSEKNEKAAMAKNGSTSQGSGKATSAGKAGHEGGGTTASEFGWYGRMLHDRFYSTWIQPTTNVPSGAKISTLVNVRIEKDGRVSKFEIIKPSENVVVNQSVAAIANLVTQVDPPPTGLIKGDHYDVKINFELNTAEQ
jgi:outer membrane biosynthesis protein TonB